MSIFLTSQQQKLYLLSKQSLDLGSPLMRFIAVLITFCCSFLAASDNYDLSSMSLEEKVGQMMMVYFDGEELNDNAKTLLREGRMGGVILYAWANGLTDAQKTRKLCQDLQEYSWECGTLPLFIAVDQEGGAVARIEGGMTDFPGNGALSLTHNLQLTFDVAHSMAIELRALGVNWNLAPVVDVNINEKNPVIGVRSFGNDAKRVAQLGKKYLEGMIEGKVIPCLKHFPGHGDTTLDSHLGLPLVNKSLKELEKVELYPFQKLASHAPAVMTSHIKFPQIDHSNCATLSSKILEEILRKQMGFDGVILTDSLTMKGVLQDGMSLAEVAYKAIQAGNDLLLIGGRDLTEKMKDTDHVKEVLHIRDALVQAVRQGEISEERIHASVKRILQLKKKFHILNSPKTTSFDLSTSHYQRHQKLAKAVAYHGVSLHKWSEIDSLQRKKILLIAPKIIETKILSSNLARLSPKGTCVFFAAFEPNEKEQKHIQSMAKKADIILFCSYNAWKFAEQQRLLQQVARKNPTILIATRDPHDVDLDISVIRSLATRSPTKPAFDVVCDWLLGQTSPMMISEETMQFIAEKIWHNECNGRVDQLTFWHEKEPFPSLGIGHFIWPGENYFGPFAEGRFHHFVTFAKQNGAKVPRWLLQKRYCPWPHREAFYQDFSSVKMQELRDFLVETKTLQAAYMLQRLNEAFYQIVTGTPVADREKVRKNFLQLAFHPGGAYVLVDYLNFKHEGIDVRERYKGKGWGLLQVLEEMGQGKDPRKSFADAAMKVLERRVMNSPQKEMEKTRLLGWRERLKTYFSEEKF